MAVLLNWGGVRVLLGDCDSCIDDTDTRICVLGYIGWRAPRPPVRAGVRPVIASAVQRRQCETPYNVCRDKSGVADSPSLVATIRGALVCPQGG